MTQKLYKILHYVECFSLPSETFIYDLINRLSVLSPEQVVFANYEFLPDSRPFKNIYFVRPFPTVLHKLAHYVLRYRTLPNSRVALRLILSLEINIIHAHFGVNGVKIFNFIRRYGLRFPLVISFHGTDVAMLATHKKYRYYCSLMAANDNCHFIFPSRYLYQKFMLHFPFSTQSRMFIIPNTVSFDKDTITPVNKSDKFNMLSVGRFIELKGFDYLINALYLLSSITQDWHTTIVGDGPLLTTLKSKVKSLGLSSNISFPGFVEHDKVLQLMQGADLYIQPSIALERTNQCESFGVSVLEALFLKKPVVVTNTGGLPDTVLGGHPDFAHIIPDKCPQSLLHSILYFMDHSNPSSSIAYFENVFSTYSIPNITSQYEAIYLKLLNSFDIISQ